VLHLTLKMYGVLSDLDRPVPNGDKGWSVGERVKVAYLGFIFVPGASI
jgi:hypothetical protein